MRHYLDRDHVSLGDYYTRHVSAMTAEGLHAKSSIAAELAWRDAEIDRLKKQLDGLVAERILGEPGASAEEISDASRVLGGSNEFMNHVAGSYADGFAHAISEIGKIMGGQDDGSGTWTEPFETVRRKILGFYHHALRMAWCKFEMRCKLREARDWIDETPGAMVDMARIGEAQALVAEIDTLLNEHHEFPRLGQADSITFQGISPDGRVVTHGSLSTVDANRDLSVMLAALELTSAVRRGVVIEPQVFFDRITSKR